MRNAVPVVALLVYSLTELTNVFRISDIINDFLFFVSNTSKKEISGDMLNDFEKDCTSNDDW